MSRELAGPWLAPANDTFDGRAYYAAKTASDGRQRFCFGWLPTRTDERDDGAWNWGDQVVVHQLTQEPDGHLSVRMPQTVAQAFGPAVPLQAESAFGPWRVEDDVITGGDVGQASVLLLGDLPTTYLVEAECTIGAGTASAGLLLRADGALDHYYALCLEPGAQRIVWDRWPRPGDQAFMIERPLAIGASEPVRLRLLVDGTCVVAYADEKVALSCRMYDHPAGEVGLFVHEGQAQFRQVSVRVRRP